MLSLAGKVALVTGASRGIGQAIAERLGCDGASVAITYAGSREKAEAVVETIKKNGTQAIAIQSDISKIEETRNLFQQVINTFGQLDIVVNNVGVSVYKLTADITEFDFDLVFNTNAKGTFFALQEAAKHINDGGRIISLSSGATKQSIPTGGLYAASKAAIEQFSFALSKELGHRGITVNLVSPGVTNTDGLIMPADALEELVQSTPLGRLGQPADIADVVAFLSSDNARWVNGQTIQVNGGIL
ncbi:SDR family oxidoreductase [Pseudanabaena sp. FACHB-2040]|uniref:SDR family oxidoreductase n=1 Tax=Pseudanabaena sp. FACHB-2040 TaxID=2692859 RepID=UPI00168507CD|nr:SDR family oxidoreductase [Pseudanabaena sp. FACHB-2040]MBD2257620.1 SDR family oxidoreductase [Pseudanabaena sp. FACHB-2040]